MKYLKNIVTGLCILIVSKSYAQDTTAMIKDFNKVMSFSVQPYLYYTAYTKVDVSSVLEAEDTLGLKGEFYKNQASLYYNNNNEEMFLDDSIFIQINHDKKSIWISRVDESSKEKMSQIPLSNKELQQLFQKKYSISKSKINEQTDRLNFETKPRQDSLSEITVNISLDYSGKMFIPQELGLNVKVKQVVSDSDIEQMKNAKVDVNSAIQKIGGANYFINNQKVRIVFTGIDFSKEKASKIPVWANKVDYDKVSTEFKGKGAYSDYEVVKMY